LHFFLDNAHRVRKHGVQFSRVPNGARGLKRNDVRLGEKNDGNTEEARGQRWQENRNGCAHGGQSADEENAACQSEGQGGGEEVRQRPITRRGG
jgi:hypothetical protein